MNKEELGKTRDTIIALIKVVEDKETLDSLEATLRLLNKLINNK